MRIMSKDYHELQFKLKQGLGRQEHHNTTSLASLARGASRVSL